MANSSYRKGYELERRVRKHFEGLGYYVTRAAGSKGVFDLVCIKNGKILGIQCKYSGYLSKTEYSNILVAAKRYGITPFLVFVKNRRTYIKNLETGSVTLLCKYHA